MRARRIGLLGGSFNPAHEGHLHISREALKRLKLDEVWWLVSPANPLKRAADLAPYATRLAIARDMAADPHIRVLDIEQRRALHYTIDSIRFLKERHPRTKFVWLMGADNLAFFHRWREWQAITRLVPIAVLDRAPYAFRALHGRFATRLAKWRLSARAAESLASQPPPAWSYLLIRRHPLSATILRKKLGRDAFLRHN